MIKEIVELLKVTKMMQEKAADCWIIISIGTLIRN